MSDTIPIQSLNTTEYKNLNTLSGIPTGASMSVQNQSELAWVRLSISETQPDLDTENYILVAPDPKFPAIISSGGNDVWARSQEFFNSVPVGIQEV
jgi:hypothetical protein